MKKLDSSAKSSTEFIKSENQKIMGKDSSKINKHTVQNKPAEGGFLSRNK